MHLVESGVASIVDHGDFQWHKQLSSGDRKRANKQGAGWAESWTTRFWLTRGHSCLCSWGFTFWVDAQPRHSEQSTCVVLCGLLQTMACSQRIIPEHVVWTSGAWGMCAFTEVRIHAWRMSSVLQKQFGARTTMWVVKYLPSLRLIYIYSCVLPTLRHFVQYSLLIVILFLFWQKTDCDIPIQFVDPLLHVVCHIWDQQPAKDWPVSSVAASMSKTCQKTKMNSNHPANLSFYILCIQLLCKWLCVFLVPCSMYFTYLSKYKCFLTFVKCDGHVCVKKIKE